jgi:hypothetical protein
LIAAKIIMTGEKQMKLFKLFSISILISGLSFNISAEEPLRIIDRGLDGNERFYSITCPDSKTSSVKVVFNFDPNAIEEISDEVRKARVQTNVKKLKISKVCIFPHSGNEKCRRKWDLDDAAKASCVVSKLKPLTDEQKKNLGKPLLGQ